MVHHALCGSLAPMQKGEPPTRRVNFSPPLASGSVGGLGREGGRLSVVIGLRAGHWGGTRQAWPASR